MSTGSSQPQVAFGNWRDAVKREFAERYDGFASWDQFYRIKQEFLLDVQTALNEEQQVVEEGMRRDLKGHTGI